jgi:glutamate-1-semialdehyde 2,1-aminomutase
MAEIAKDGVPQLGTFNGNPLGARAGLVALTEVLTEDAYKELNRLNDAQLAGCQRVIDDYGLPCYTTGVGGKGAVMYAPERCATTAPTPASTATGSTATSRTCRGCTR